MKYLMMIGFVALGACSSLNLTPEPIAPPLVVVSENMGLRPVARPETGVPLVVPVSAVPIDAQTATGKPAVTSKTLGTTVASLGNPAEPGMWMKTPLVSVEQQGEITAASGRKITVNLIPIDGPDTGGSQLSLQAMQALGAALTSLPEVAVSLI